MENKEVKTEFKGNKILTITNEEKIALIKLFEEYNKNNNEEETKED